MKKYIYYKVKLFAGLLSFNAFFFFACISKRQKLCANSPISQVLSLSNALPTDVNFRDDSPVAVSTSQLLVGLSGSSNPEIENIINSIINRPGNSLVRTTRSLSSIPDSLKLKKDPEVLDDQILQYIDDQLLRTLWEKEKKEKYKEEWEEHWIDKVKRLFKKGLSIEAQDDKGETLLIKAVKDSHQAAVEFLLNNGANVHAKNKDGETALFFAARVLLNKIAAGSWSTRDDILDLLIKFGADMCVKNCRGQCVLDLAKSYYHSRGKLLLIKKFIEELSRMVEKYPGGVTR